MCLCKDGFLTSADINFVAFIGSLKNESFLAP